MKYKATVIVNDYNVIGCPSPGYIKVICPEVFGYYVDPEVEFEEVRDSFFESPWLEPILLAPHDFYIPMLGDFVWIEETNNGWAWTGSYIGGSRVNYVTQANELSLPASLIAKTERILGTRWGSYLKLDDEFNGNVTLEAQGGVDEWIEKRGPRLLLQGIAYNQKAHLSAYGPDPDNPSRDLMEISVGGALGSEKLEISDWINKAWIAFDKDSITVKRTDDSGTATVTLNSAGIAIVDQNGGYYKLTSDGFEIKDSSGNEIKSSSTSVTINGNLEVLK